MNPKVRRMNWFVRLITNDFAIAITLAPFGIFIEDKYWDDEFVLNHEKIHWYQQLEMLFIFFYLWYFFEWLIRLVLNQTNAYDSISFEKEAYYNEKDFDYLMKRKSFAWFRYLKN